MCTFLGVAGKINEKDIDEKVIKNSDFEKDILKISFGKKKHYLVKVI